MLGDGDCTVLVTDDLFRLLLGDRLASLVKMSGVDIADDRFILFPAERLAFSQLAGGDLIDDRFAFLPVETLSFIVSTSLLTSGVDFTDDCLTILPVERLPFFVTTSLLTSLASGVCRETLEFGNSWCEGHEG